MRITRAPMIRMIHDRGHVRTRPTAIIIDIAAVGGPGHARIRGHGPDLIRAILTTITTGAHGLVHAPILVVVVTVLVTAATRAVVGIVTAHIRIAAQGQGHTQGHAQGHDPIVAARVLVRAAEIIGVS